MEKTIFDNGKKEVTIGSYISLSRWLIGFEWLSMLDVGDNRHLSVGLKFLCMNFYVEYWGWAENES